MQSKIFEIIRRCEKDYQQKPVRVVDGYDFNQSETIKRIHLYANAQFVDGNEDSIGQKVFFDVSTPAVRNAAKNIDIDTKDIQFKAINGKSNYFRSWLYRRKAKDWMRENGIAKKLNLIPEKVSGIGSIVVKKVEGSRVFDFVDLRNLACDPTAKTLNDGWTSERHYYTPIELRKQKERGWDADQIEIAIKNFITFRQENYVGDENTTTQQFKKSQYIAVHEFYGYVEKKLLTEEEDDEDLVLANFLVVMPQSSKQGKDSSVKSNDEGLILFKTELKEMPFKELHYRKVDGRWLGRGIYEECFPMQEVKNTQGNWMLMAMRLSQLIVFQTRDKTVLQNILSDVENGSIMKFGASEVPKTMLERVDTQVKDNSSSQLLSSEVSNVLRNLTNAFEVTTGETLPSGTPFSLGALLDQNAAKLFDFIREDYGIFLEEVFNDWVLPELEKEMKKEGILEIVDEDELDYLREHFINAKVWETTKDFLMSGLKPTTQQIEMVKTLVREQAEKQDSLFLDFPKDYLDFEKRVTCFVTDESESPAMLQTLTTVMQAVVQNPAILDMPAFEKILDMVGLATIDVKPKTGALLPPQQPQQALPA